MLLNIHLALLIESQCLLSYLSLINSNYCSCCFPEIDGGTQNSLEVIKFPN